MFTEFRSILIILFWFDNPWVDLVFTWPSTHLEICDFSGIFEDYLHPLPLLHSQPSQYTERWWHPMANVLVDFLSTNKTETDLRCYTKLDQNDLERFVRFTLILVNHTHKNPPWIWYQWRPPHQLSEKIGWMGWQWSCDNSKSYTITPDLSYLTGDNWQWTDVFQEVLADLKCSSTTTLPLCVVTLCWHGPSASFDNINLKSVTIWSETEFW